MENRSNVVVQDFVAPHRIAETIREVASALLSHADKFESRESNLSEHYSKALDLLHGCKGYVIISGMGKSGHIGKKLAATLASTGTPAFFVHPGEAFHGDLGMFTPSSVVLLISNSGKTSEILSLLPSLKRFGNKIIAMTGDDQSPLAISADAILDIQVEKEICPINLAPTTSTTLTAVVGDAVAVELMRRKKFKPLDFARFHPGGSLGRLLLTKVQEEMIRIVPLVSADAGWEEVTSSIEAGGLGATVVVSEDRELLGVITDGDVRRAVAKLDFHRHQAIASDIMTVGGVTIKQTASMYDAVELMKAMKIKFIVVLDGASKVAGAVQFAG